MEEEISHSNGNLYQPNPTPPSPSKLESHGVEEVNMDELTPTETTLTQLDPSDTIVDELIPHASTQTELIPNGTTLARYSPIQAAQKQPDEKEDMDIQTDEHQPCTCKADLDMPELTDYQEEIDYFNVQPGPSKVDSTSFYMFCEPSCSSDTRDQSNERYHASNLRVTWESIDRRQENRHLSMNAIVNIPIEKVMESIKSFFEKKRDPEEVITDNIDTNEGTSTSNFTDNQPSQSSAVTSESSGISLQYDYFYPSDYEYDSD